MGAPQYEQAGADVSGSGTPGTIPVWSSGTTLGNSIVTQTAQGVVVTGFTNGLLPTSGSTPTNASFLVRGPLTNALFMGASSASPFGTWLQSTDAAVLGNWYPLLLNPNGGNVGIGTASPVASAKLTLGGAANSSIRLSYQTGGTTEVAFDQMNSATGEFRHSSGVSAGWGGSHTFYTDTTEKVKITSTGNVHASSGTTSMTDGFFYIPAAAGAPTGVPTAISGRVPMYYDTTNNNFYVYNGGWKKVLLA